MNVLIIGNGGRENALAWAIEKNESVQKIYIIDGNAGSEKIKKCERISFDINNKNELIKSYEMFTTGYYNKCVKMVKISKCDLFLQS